MRLNGDAADVQSGEGVEKGADEGGAGAGVGCQVDGFDFASAGLSGGC